MLISFFFGYLESFFVVFYLSFHFHFFFCQPVQQMLESTHFNCLSRNRGDLYRFFLVDWKRAPECPELRLWLRRMRSSLDWLKCGYRLEQLSRACDHAVCCVQCQAVGEWLPEDMSFCKARPLRFVEPERGAPCCPSETAAYAAGALGVTVAVALARVPAAAISDSPSALDEDAHTPAAELSAFGGGSRATAAAGNLESSASSDVGACAVRHPSGRAKRRRTLVGKKAKPRSTVPPARASLVFFDPISLCKELSPLRPVFVPCLSVSPEQPLRLLSAQVLPFLSRLGITEQGAVC